MERWPNFFIVGAPKAGTTSLYAYLNTIPGIYMSKNKEPNYFSFKNLPNYRKEESIEDKKKYLALFDNVKDEKIIGEASTTYLSDPDSAELIHQISPKSRIIILLRNPADRAFSHYLMLLRYGVSILPFHKKLLLALGGPSNKNDSSMELDEGMYFENVKKYLDLFGKNQVKILIFEEFIKKPKEMVEEIVEFLGIKNPIINFEAEIFNPFGIARGSISQYIIQNKKLKKLAIKILNISTRRILREKILIKKQPKPKMSSEDREILIKFYQDDVKKLKTILEIPVQWLDFKND